MITSKHGSLESAILSVLWDLEEDGKIKNSVKDVYNYLNSTSEDKKAYTTIKTVMDRLYEKRILTKIKYGNKYYYRTLRSNSEIIGKSLNELAQRYCGGDMRKLINLAEMYERENQLIGV